MKKTRSKKSCDTVPLNAEILRLYSLSYIFFDVMPGWRRAGSWLDAD
jgi:hypothetical protein